MLTMSYACQRHLVREIGGSSLRSYSVLSAMDVIPLIQINAGRPGSAKVSHRARSWILVSGTRDVLSDRAKTGALWGEPGPELVRRLKKILGTFLNNEACAFLASDRLDPTPRASPTFRSSART